MARFADRQKALELRKQNMSYSQIKKVLNLSKSTLSCWLRNYPLSKERIRELRDRNEQRIERYRETMKQKREARLSEMYKEQTKIVLPLSKRELFLGGLFLYWGEGSKGKMSEVGLSNTDPAMIKFFIRWTTECLGVQKEKIKIHIHLYTDMDITKEIEFWSSALNIPHQQFTKPYIKKSLLVNINHKGGFGHGTCNVRIGNARMSESIMMALKNITDNYA